MKDYSRLKEHCYKTLKLPTSPKTKAEHLMVLELIEYYEEQETALDNIRAEIEELDEKYVIRDYATYGEHSPKYVPLWEVLQIIDKYKESEE